MSYVGDYAMFPKGARSPSGTWEAGWDPGDTGYQDPFAYVSPNFRYDPELGGIFDVIAAPFKTIGKGAYEFGKTVVKAAPTAATGLLMGGIPGLIAAGGSSLIAQWTQASPEERARIEAQVVSNIANQSAYGSGAYGDPIQAAASSVWSAARYRAGELIAQTPEGQAAIQRQAGLMAVEKAKGLAPWLLPAAIVGGVLLLARR